MLGGVGVPLDEERTDFYFPREEKLLSPAGKKHHIVFVSLLESQLPALHAAWLPGQRGKSVSTSCFMEQEHCRQQPLNQQQLGGWGTQQTLPPSFLVPRPRSCGPWF